MIIEKDRLNVGWYIAHTWANGEYFVGSDKSHTLALIRLFAKLKWAEVGNWQKNG